MSRPRGLWAGLAWACLRPRRPIVDGSHISVSSGATQPSGTWATVPELRSTTALGSGPSQPSPRIASRTAGAPRPSAGATVSEKAGRSP
eukprot:15114431-Alexandrium_andersonii.AAC.1